MTAAVLRAAADEPNVTPGLLGFLVVAGLGVATWLLLRSMRRQMRKINVDGDDEPPSHPPPAAGSAPDPVEREPGDPTAPADPPDPGGSAR